VITFLKSLKCYSGNDLVNNLEYIRNLRNSCRFYMTRDQGEITKEQQKLWYNSLNDNIIPYIFLVMEDETRIYPCGYGLIKYQHDNIAFLTAALSEDMRGKGLGRKIFSDLIEIVKEKVDKICLEVLESNYRARKLYSSLGFKEINRKDSILFLEKY